jgi:chromosome segregation ATPase
VSNLYSGLSTLLYASISAMKASELDVYVRKKSLQVPDSMFDTRDWLQALQFAKECRTKESKSNQIRNLELLKNDTRASEIHELEMRITREVSEAVTDVTASKNGLKKELENMDSFISVMSRQIKIVIDTLNDKLNVTNIDLENALTTLENEKYAHSLEITERVKNYRELHRKILDTEVNNKKELDLLMISHENKIDEKKYNEKNYFLEIENLKLQLAEKDINYEALESKFIVLEGSNKQISSDMQDLTQKEIANKEKIKELESSIAETNDEADKYEDSFEADPLDDVEPSVKTCVGCVEKDIFIIKIEEQLKNELDNNLILSKQSVTDKNTIQQSIVNGDLTAALLSSRRVGAIDLERDIFELNGIIKSYEKVIEEQRREVGIYLITRSIFDIYVYICIHIWMYVYTNIYMHV